MSESRCSRRGFIRVCGSAAALAAGVSLAETGSDEPLSHTEPARLTWSDGSDVRVDALETEREYLFFYPYRSTPCFLLQLPRPAVATDLDTEQGEHYRWQGGVGEQRRIVAFSAICAHKMSRPTTTVSFVGYRKDPVGYPGPDDEIVRRGGVIQCCSEGSVYDPARGARVLSGPARQPLAAIRLQDRDGVLFAGGVHGGALFERFFDNFGYRLALEFGEDEVRRRVSGRAVVVSSERYVSKQIHC